jgi:hypothetical protein
MRQTTSHMSPALAAAIKEASVSYEEYARLKKEDDDTWAEWHKLGGEIRRIEDRIVLGEMGAADELRNALVKRNAIDEKINGGRPGGCTSQRCNASSAYADAVHKAQRRFAREFLRNDEYRALERQS